MTVNDKLAPQVYQDAITHINDYHIFVNQVSIDLFETVIQVSMRFASLSQYFPALILPVSGRRESFLKSTKAAHIPVSKLGYAAYPRRIELR
jgi:hypothetical protein